MVNCHVRIISSNFSYKNRCDCQMILADCSCRQTVNTICNFVMHFQVWRILALVALVFVFSSTAINPDAIDKVDEVNGIIGHFEKSGHSIQKRDDEPAEPEEAPAPPTTIKPIKKKKKTEEPQDESEPTVKPIKKKKKPSAAADPGRITIINKIVNKGPKGGRHGKQNHDDYNEQPPPAPVAAPVAAQPAAQASGGGGFWSFLKNVAEVVHIGVLGG